MAEPRRAKLESPAHERLEELYAQSVEALERNRAELARLQQRVALGEERVNSLRRLVFEASPDPSSVNSGSPRGLIGECEAVLAEHGDMRLSDLREALFRRGVPLPGKGTNANLVGYLNRSAGRIVRKRRGVYGLPTEAAEKNGSASSSAHVGCSPSA